jgi:4-aminobutyrate aminotransferase-like enzyme
MTNSGHGHLAIREALSGHVPHGLLAQFNFPSEIRVRLAEKLIELTPPHMETQVNRPTVKICPPLVITAEAAIAGVRAIGDAIETVLSLEVNRR